MPNTKALLIAAGAYSVAYLAAAATHTEEVPKRAPYQAIRWESEEPIVRIDDDWVTLVSINGVAVGDIVRYCHENYDDLWRKRFEEDLVEVMAGMGNSPGKTVRLVVRDSPGSEERTLDDVGMTLANRQAIWLAANAGNMLGYWHEQSLPKRAPYDAIKWNEHQPSVRIDGAWYTLASIEDLETCEIVDYCRKTYRLKWRKRFEEDLEEVLNGMGHRPGETVKLMVIDPVTEEKRTLERVAMTKENRRAIWSAAQNRNRLTPSDEGRDGESADASAE